MGEEEKKPEEKMEEKKSEEVKKPAAEEGKKDKDQKEPRPAADKAAAAGEEKKEEKKPEESKDSKESKDESPPPPQEIVLKVYMHCEGCARKVRRCLKGFDGVEDVITDCKTSKVVVKGAKADPLRVLERVQRKSHRQVELISPIPKPPSEEEKKAEEEKPKPEEKKEEQLPVVTVVLRVYMHCEACAMEIKKRIQRMKGVESAEPDLKSSQVTVKGVFDPPKLVEYVYKRTGKHAVIVRQEPEKKEEKKGKEEPKEDNKKGEAEGDKEKKSDGDQVVENKETKENTGADGEPKSEDPAAAAVVEETKVVELKKNEYMYCYPHPQRYFMELNAYPPQIFSDENPNACSVM